MTLPKLNLYHLVTFYVVACEKSFTVAAEKIFLTEPAVSLQIKSLERCTGVKLLNVERKKVHLTKAGETLFVYAEKIYKQAKNAEQFLENLRGRSLCIGVAMTFSSVIVSVACRFEELFPHTKLSIRNGPSYQIIDELLDLQHDIAVVVSSNYRASKLRVIRISDYEELVLVALPSSPIFSRGDLKLAELSHYPLLLPPQKSGTRKILLECFESEGQDVSRSILVETDYVECAKRLAEEGKGIALMHVTNVEREVDQGKLKVLPLVREIRIAADIVVHREVPQPPIGERFISLVKEAFQARHCQ